MSPDAVVVAVSLDGVLVPMKDGQREEKRAARKARGQLAKGPAGYHEASCATLFYYDRTGNLLHTVRLGRMPESGKVTLKGALAEELVAALARRPDLRVVTIADGVKDNWAYLSTLPGGRGTSAAGEGRRPPVEVADIFRAHGVAYRQTHALTQALIKVMRAIETCRTAVLGGHLDVCDACGDTRPAYNSCRNRHCPKCQALKQATWIAARQERVLLAPLPRRRTRL